MILDKCVLCSSNRYHIIHKGIRKNVRTVLDRAFEINESISVYKCDCCGLIRLSEMPDDIELFYKESGMRDYMPSDAKLLRESGDKEFTRYFHQTKKLVEEKTVIDFGCGCGGYINKVKDIASSVIGIELEDNMRKQLTDEGFACVSSIDEIGSCDIVTMFHSLAHLNNPVDYLKRIKSHLNRNGKIYIETPNSEDVLLSLYQNESFSNHAFHRDMPWYYNINSLKTIANLVEMNIEKIEYIQRYPLANHLFWLSKGLPGGEKVWDFLNNDNLNLYYGKVLGDIGKTDTIAVLLSLNE